MGLLNQFMTISSLSGASWAKAFSGSFVVNVGNNVTGSYGMNYFHSFGPNITLTADAGALGLGAFLGPFFNSPSTIMAPLTGISGQASFYYGPYITATYGGPLINIRRGPQIDKVTSTPPGFFTGDTSWYSLVTGSLGTPNPTDSTLAAEDASTLLAVNIMSMIMNLSTVALELAIRFAYPDYTSASDPYGVAPVALEGTLTFLVPRIMGFITVMEQCGGWENMSTAATWNAIQYLASAANVVSGVGTVVSGIGTVVAWPFKTVAKKFDEASDDVKWGLLWVAIIIILLSIAIGLAVAAAMGKL